jgi:hypothetical protein
LIDAFAKNPLTRRWQRYNLLKCHGQISKLRAFCDAKNIPKARGDDMAKRITIDPITRIEGHLRIEVEVAGGKVVNAWSSGQMFRGIEIILQGRDPRDAPLFVQRSCGV